MIILSDADIAGLLSLNEIINTVEAALVAYEKKESIVPQRMHFDHDNGTLLCMPSFGKQFFGTKLVSVVPGNATKGLPVTNGVMLLNDAVTGLPVALMNASKLTALRTGALGAIGVKYLSPATENTFGVIGCGVQGLHLAISICALRPFLKVYYLSRSNESGTALISFIKQHYPDQKVEACRTAEELLSKTNITVLATTSDHPVLPDDPELLNGKHFIGIGSYKPSMQEFPDSVFKLAGKLAIDSEFARHETGDTINPIKKGILNEEDVFTIGKIILGEKLIDTTQTTVFKSAGMALFDLFVAQRLYEKALKVNAGSTILL
jgi:ornithine cyclodeaminase/alanine dehydrogenase-like protein (mu-crystallin family)